MLFADDIVICEETRKEEEQILESRKYALERRGMKVSRSKTEYLCINGGNDDEVTKKQMEVMKIADIKMLRFAMGATRKDKIRNEYIRSTVKVERLGMKMREGRLRWYGDVMRRGQEYLGRKMMEMELPGKWKRGRPKKRFLDVVKEDMGKVGAKETDVEDRKVWRMTIRCGQP